MRGRRWGTLGILTAGLLLLGGGCRAETPTQAVPGVTVVVDAGHGGIDHGSSGTLTGVYEDELNLQVALRLEQTLTDAGCTVVMTRESSEIVYDPSSGLTRKTQDMRQRTAVIQAASPDVVISIHMNKYPDGRYGGPQVFYQQSSQPGAALAGAIQTQFNANIEGSTRSALASDYYILKASEAPSVLVECGFLSNRRDEARLQTEEYQQLLAELIRDGLLNWLANREN